MAQKGCILLLFLLACHGKQCFYQFIIFIQHQSFIGLHIGKHCLKFFVVGVSLHHFHHTSGFLGKQNHSGNLFGFQRLQLYIQLFICNRRAEQLLHLICFKFVCLLFRFGNFGILFFLQGINIRIDTLYLQLDVLIFIFEEGNEGLIHRRIHDGSLQTLLLEQADILRLLIGVGCKINHVFVLFLILFQIFGNGFINAVCCFQQQDILYLIIQLFFLHTAVFDEDIDIIPEAFKGRTVGFEQLVQLVRNLLGDVGIHFFHIAVILQCTSGNIQRHIGTVQNPLQEQQKFGDNLFYVIRNINLIAIELNLTVHHVHLLHQLREIENPFQTEGVIHIQMNPEQRVI